MASVNIVAEERPRSSAGALKNVAAEFHAAVGPNVCCISRDDRARDRERNRGRVAREGKLKPSSSRYRYSGVCARKGTIVRGNCHPIDAIKPVIFKGDHNRRPAYRPTGYIANPD